MSELTTIARPYAEAAFKYAQQTNHWSEWATVLEIFATVFALTLQIYSCLISFSQ